MTGKDRRLQKVTSALSGKERALLVLRSWKAGEEEDPAWRLTMLDSQEREFNRLIRLMNGVNRGLGFYVFCLQQEVQILSLRAGGLATFLLWQLNAAKLADHIQYETKEPVTKSEYEEREAKARAEPKPVAELAEVLVERYEGWREEDLADEQGEDDAVYVKPEVWERLRKGKEREIARLVKDGALQGSGKGKNLRVSAGSFYDWLGEQVPVHSVWARELEVVADDDKEARGRRAWRDKAREAYRFGPTQPVVHLPDLDMDFGEPSKIDEVVGRLRETLREGVEEQWRQLRAVELVLSEVAEEFDGEPPELPDVRHVLDRATEKLRDLHEEAQRYVGPFELGEPSEEEVTSIREILERAGE